jgi:GRIM-19 protein
MDAGSCSHGLHKFACLIWQLGLRSYVIAKAQADAVEAEIMKNVPGWVVGESVYSPGARWMPPTRPAGVWGD